MKIFYLFCAMTVRLLKKKHNGGKGKHGDQNLDTTVIINNNANDFVIVLRGNIDNFVIVVTNVGTFIIFILNNGFADVAVGVQTVSTGVSIGTSVENRAVFTVTKVADILSGQTFIDNDSAVIVNERTGGGGTDTAVAVSGKRETTKGSSARSGHGLTDFRDSLEDGDAHIDDVSSTTLVGVTQEAHEVRFGGNGTSVDFKRSANIIDLEIATIESRMGGVLALAVGHKDLGGILKNSHTFHTVVGDGLIVTDGAVSQTGLGQSTETSEASVSARRAEAGVSREEGTDSIGIATAIRSREVGNVTNVVGGGYTNQSKEEEHSDLHPKLKRNSLPEYEWFFYTRNGSYLPCDWSKYSSPNHYSVVPRYFFLLGSWMIVMTVILVG